MLFKTFSAAVFGIDAYLVEVEADVHQTFEGYYSVVGLPDLAVKESRERFRSALRNCGFEFPSQQAVIVNLAPADIRKEGSAFDLPMTLGLLGCQATFFARNRTGSHFHLFCPRRDAESFADAHPAVTKAVALNGISEPGRKST